MTTPKEERSMLKETRRWLVALIVVAAISAPVAYGAVATHSRNPAGQIGYVALDERFLLAPDLIRAFVPTGSVDHRCLVTFSESTIGDFIGPAPFCGARTVNGVKGVLITVWLEQPVDDMYLSLTVFQQFAKGYGQPRLYNGT
jgi:hypothetical protein